MSETSAVVSLNKGQEGQVLSHQQGQNDQKKTKHVTEQHAICHLFGDRLFVTFFAT